jgi:hypothetical protein
MKHFTEGRMKLQMVALILAVFLVIVHPGPLALGLLLLAIFSWAMKRVSLAKDHQERLDQ